jgi:hypothetical protein
VISEVELLEVFQLEAGGLELRAEGRVVLRGGEVEALGAPGFDELASVDPWHRARSVLAQRKARVEQFVSTLVAQRRES